MLNIQIINMIHNNKALNKEYEEKNKANVYPPKW